MSTETLPAASETAPDTEVAVLDACQRARSARTALASLPRARKDAVLHALADALVAAGPDVLAGNAADLRRAADDGMSPALQDRLRLTEERIGAIAQQLRDTAALPDPVGEVLRGQTLPNGLVQRQVRVPLGVVGMIYEARPNVTVDAVGLCLKSGNAVLLRGGSAAASSNTAIVAALRSALEAESLPADLVTSLDEFGREGSDVMLRARGLVDVVVPRGGSGLIQHVVRTALVPTIETGTGNCHVYVDASADLDDAVAIIRNAKLQKTGACNAVETLLVHRDAASALLPALAAAMSGDGVTLHADGRARALLPAVGGSEETGLAVQAATETDWETEYLALDLAVKVVDSLDEAIGHIRTYSTEHTEVILTSDLQHADRFTREIDAAVVMVNASPRFTDGGEFGFGAEIGISTQKLHARGPMGLPELTTTTWQIFGQGHVRP